MKRLLCVVSGMNAGGAETFLMKIYRRLDKSCFQMDFAVNIDAKGFYDDEIIRMGGKILKFPAKSESLFRYIMGLKKIIQNGKYDTVLRITSNAMGFMDLAVAKMAGARVCVARSSNSSDGGHIKTKIAHWFGKFLFKRFVDVKIAPSTEAAVYTFGKKDFHRGLVHVLPNGLDLKYFSYSESGRQSVRNEFGVSFNQKVVGHVGRFSLQKNHSFLLNVFCAYHKKCPDSILMLVGEGELQNDIQKKVEEMRLEKSVLFVGVRSDMPSIYSAMDVFVFPSLYEGMPNAVIEAQACGLKCVISDHITKEADVTNNVSYLSIKENDIQVWVDEIVKSKNEAVDACNLPSEYDIKNVVLKFTDICFGRLQ
ncbi:MAG: glycosyltransferase family 1 protein [Fibrobacter sp.]|nr:glycosyltransferase family 1 protein [Fibrobacter sp.]MDY6389290.1 glycosyltransferase family 1 protein [Fibrobacter sp.]